MPLRAMRLMPRKSPSWTVPVLTCSGLSGDGIDAIWDAVLAYREALTASGEWERDRGEQRVAAMWRALEWEMMAWIHEDPRVLARVDALAAAVRAGATTPDLAAATLLARLDRSEQTPSADDDERA